jgi:hypothetical protein
MPKKNEPEDSIQAIKKDDKRLDKAGEKKKTDDKVVNKLTKWAKDIDKGK